MGQKVKISEEGDNKRKIKKDKEKTRLAPKKSASIPAERGKPQLQTCAYMTTKSL